MILLVLILVQKARAWCTADAVSLDLSSVSLFLVGYRLKESFLVTGSQDCTVKLWPLPEALLSKNTAVDSGPMLLQSQTTQRCHDKVATRGLWDGVWLSPRMGWSI